MRHKMPEIILKYIIAQAHKDSSKGSPSEGKTGKKGKDKFMKMASKISGSKKMDERFNRTTCEIC